MNVSSVESVSTSKTIDCYFTIFKCLQISNTENGNFDIN